MLSNSEFALIKNKIANLIHFPDNLHLALATYIVKEKNVSGTDHEFFFYVDDNQFIEKNLKIDLQELLKKLNSGSGNFFGSDYEDFGYWFLLIGTSDYTVEFKEGYANPGYLIVPFPLYIKEYDSVIKHTTQLWPDLMDVIGKATRKILIIDRFCTFLDYKIRFNLFRKVLLSIIDCIPCLAIHWNGSQKFTNPYKVGVYSPLDQDRLNLLDLAVNVCMFTIEKSNEIIMDTVGLSAFGLPDLQCHYKKLNPNDVA